MDDLLLLREVLISRIRAMDDSKVEAWLDYRKAMLIERWNTVAAAERDEETRSLIIYRCRKNFWFFLRTFGVVYEDRKTAPYGAGLHPFIPFPHQEWAAQFFWSVFEEGDVGLCMKTRDMGISWVIYHMIVWMFLFDENFSCLMGSRNSLQVDTSAGKLNTQTMFGRIETIINNLPEWLRPGLDMTDKDQRQHMWWKHPLNGNLIAGEASTGNFGRQGRYTLGFLDEFDHWEDPTGAINAARDSCGAIFLVTTLTGKVEGVSKRIVEEEKARVLELPWYLHPYKTSEWYEKAKKGRFDEAMATEVDMSLEGSKSLLIYPEWGRIKQGDFPFRPDWWTYGGIDFGRTDGCGLVWVQRSPRSLMFRIIGAYYRAGQTFEHFLPFMGGPLLANHADYSQQTLGLIDKTRYWEQCGVEWFGDPAGRQKTVVSNHSVLDKLASHSIYVTTNSRALSHADRQAATHTLLHATEGVNIADCGMLDRSMKRYRRAEKTDNSTADTSIKPVHKWSDLPSALEYVSVNVPKPKTEAPEKKQRRKAVWER
jgi:hypothetical protein